MKQEVFDDRIQIEVFEETIEDMIVSWQKIYDEYINPTYHTRNKIEYDHYGYDGAYDIYLVLYRLETDKEEHAREERERIAVEKREKKRLAKLAKKMAEREKQEAAERAEYERLKEKYGDM